MTKQARSIRSYNAFLRAAKSSAGVSHKQAQALYRSLKQRLGEKPTRATLKAHPRITKQEVNNVTRQPKRKVIRSFEDYEDMGDDFDFEDEDIAAGVDYGEE